MTGYYDRQGNPTTADAWPSHEDRRVDRTVIRESADDDDGITVSTVHLVLDHSFGDGPPLIFETMIFGGEHDQWCGRYSTEEQAKAGHEAVVAWLRGEAEEPHG